MPLDPHLDLCQASDMSALARCIQGFGEIQVAVLGDPVLDRYLYGTTHRISREAPVLIVKEEREELQLGGAANTAANLAALGAQTQLLGVIGKDDSGRSLRRIAGEKGIRVDGLMLREDGCTVTKTRILAGGLHTTRQQMLRLDRENDLPLPQMGQRVLKDVVLDRLSELSVLIISDYGDGSLTETYAEIAQIAREQGKIVVVDSRYALSHYQGVSAITPNEPEAEAALGIKLRTKEEAEAAAHKLTKDLKLDATVLTRGKEGMVIAAKDGSTVHLDAVGGEAVDVTGAGDTVAATFSLALGTGASLQIAGELSNLAASIVVQQTGTVPCYQQELTEALQGSQLP